MPDWSGESVVVHDYYSTYRLNNNNLEKYNVIGVQQLTHCILNNSLYKLGDKKYKLLQVTVHIGCCFECAQDLLHLRRAL